MDSVLAVEVAASISTSVGLSLPATLVFDFPSIDAIADHISNRFLENVSSESHALSTEEPPQPAHGMEIDNKVGVGGAFVGKGIGLNIKYLVLS
jgi:Phosphopantetheine attachment site